MKMLVVNREITLSILTVMVLIYGLSGVSYGEDAITILSAECDTHVGDFVPVVTVTVKGTIRANRDVEDVRGWITINGERISGGVPAINDPFLGYLGGRSFGDLSAGQTKPFSITEKIFGGVSDGDRCGLRFEWTDVDPPQPDQLPEQENEANTEQPEKTLKVCQVGDVIAPGESCTYVADGKDIGISRFGLGIFHFFRFHRSYFR